MKKQNLVFSLGCFLSLFLQQHAFAFITELNECNGHWYLTAGAGRTEPIINSSNYIGTGPGWPTDHYIADDTHGSAMAVVGAGYTLSQYNEWLPEMSLGLQFTYTGLAKTSGVIDQYSLAQFENYSYSYQFRRQTLLAVGKVDIYRFYGFMPYLTGGLGVSFNTTSNYIEQPLPNVTPRISPGYNSATHHYFSYMAGVGLDYVICPYLWLSAEYNYGSYGNVQTGYGVDTPSLAGFDYSSQRLKNGLSANNFLLSLTYLLNYV